MVNEDGSYVEWVFPISYAKKKYDWKVLSRKRWWQTHVVEVTPEEFYKFADKKIIDYCWKEKK